jgi:hypothetical protein
MAIMLLKIQRVAGKWFESFISLKLISNQSFVKKYKLIDEQYQHKELYKIWWYFIQ